jgi:hypothetical protein
MQLICPTQLVRGEHHDENDATENVIGGHVFGHYFPWFGLRYTDGNCIAIQERHDVGTHHGRFRGNYGGTCMCLLIS